MWTSLLVYKSFAFQTWQRREALFWRTFSWLTKSKKIALFIWDYADSLKQFILKAFWMNCSSIVWCLTFVLSRAKNSTHSRRCWTHSGCRSVCRTIQLWIIVIYFQEICLHGDLLLLVEPTEKWQFDRNKAAPLAKLHSITKGAAAGRVRCGPSYTCLTVM